MIVQKRPWREASSLRVVDAAMRPTRRDVTWTTPRFFWWWCVTLDSTYPLLILSLCNGSVSYASWRASSFRVSRNLSITSCDIWAKLRDYILPRCTLRGETGYCESDICPSGNAGAIRPMHFHCVVAGWWAGRVTAHEISMENWRLRAWNGAVIASWSFFRNSDH
jgi:hypothetical protein